MPKDIDETAMPIRHGETRHKVRGVKDGGRRTFYRKWWFWLIVAVVVVVIGVAGIAAWVGTRALEAKSELEAALPLASDIQAQVLAGDAEGAAKTAEKMANHTEVARNNTNDPVWVAMEAVPVLGPNLAAVRQLADITDDLADEAIVPLAKLAPLLQGSSFKPVDGAINLAPLIEAKTAVADASASVTSSLQKIEAIDTKPLLDQVSGASTQLETMLAKYEPTLQTASSIIAVVPDALGASGPRNYLLAFQNPTEVMPRGGTVGSLAVIHVENGKVELTQQASPLDFPLRKSTIIPVPDDAQALWVGLGKNMQNLTETPRFSLSFEVAHEMWLQKFGVSIDGLIALDPIALSYIVGATGPITLDDGSVLTGDNLVQSLLSDVYVKYPNPLDQDAYYQKISSTTFGAITGGNFDPMTLFTAVMTAAEQKRVLMWTSNTAEQALLAGSPFQGEPIPTTDVSEGVGAYFRDYTPSKMSYYLNQTVDIAQASCPDTDTRKTRVTVTLANTITPAVLRTLPAYVSTPHDVVKRGDLVLGVKIYGPEGSTFVGGQSGSFATVGPGSDGSYSIGETRDHLHAGDSITSVFDFVSPGAALKTMLSDVSPVVNPTNLNIHQVECSAIQ